MNASAATRMPKITIWLAYLFINWLIYFEILKYPQGVDIHPSKFNLLSICPFKGIGRYGQNLFFKFYPANILHTKRVLQCTAFSWAGFESVVSWLLISVQHHHHYLSFYRSIYLYLSKYLYKNHLYLHHLYLYASTYLYIYLCIHPCICKLCPTM